MTISYTGEAKFPQQESGGYNWGAIINGVLEALDKGAEFTFTFAETVTAGSAVALNINTGQIHKAQALVSTLTPAIGFAPYAVSSGNQGKVRTFGWIDVDTSYASGASVSWAAGELVYPDSVAGRITKTQWSYANALGYAKNMTNASWITRVAIRPEKDFWTSSLFTWLTAHVFDEDGDYDSEGDIKGATLTLDAAGGLSTQTFDSNSRSAMFVAYDEPNDYSCFSLAFRRARGTKASPGDISDGDWVVKWPFYFWYSSGWNQSGGFIYRVTDRTTGAGEFNFYYYSGSAIYIAAIGAANTRFGDVNGSDYLKIDHTKGDLSHEGTSEYIAKRSSQSAQPTPGSGAIQMWRDTDDDKTYLVYTDPDVGARKVELT